MDGIVSTSVSSSNSSDPSSRRRRGSRRSLIIVCSVLSLFLVGAVVVFKGHVSGTEFAPSHFQTREFSFYEVPFLHIQITPIDRKNITGPVARQILAKSWINVPRGTPPVDWHLVVLYRGPTGTPAVAGLLIDELALQESGNAFWKRWNTDHPQRASVLWPTVQLLAQRELYILIPELMHLARSLPGNDNAVELQADVDVWLIGQYASLVKDLREADRAVLADEMLAEALSDYPSSAELADLRGTGG